MVNGSTETSNNVTTLWQIQNFADGGGRGGRGGEVPKLKILKVPRNG